MALLKLICNTGAKLFVDQEFVSELQENKLCITELSAGMYLVDAVSLIDDQIKVSFELSFENDNQQILKRIDLAEEEKKCKQHELKSELMRNPNLSFYRNLARFEYNGLWGYVDSNYEIVVEPIYSSAEDFVNDFALVGKLFSEGIKYALIDTIGKNRMGVWFDELIFRDEKRLFVRRNNDLLSYDVLKGTLFTYNLSGEIKDDDLIPVLWENNYSKKGGYINLRGEVVLPFIYDQVSNFNEDGFAEVERFGFKRFITKDGAICLYNTLSEIKNNHYYIHDKGKHIYLLNEQFDWCGPLIWGNGRYRIAVKMGDKWGYCLLWGSGKDCLKNIIPYEYDAPLYDSAYNFVILRRGRYVCMVNVSDEQYKGGSKKGQCIYGKIGQEFFRIEAEDIYPIIEKEFHTEYSNSIIIVNRFVIKQRGKYGIIDKRTKQYVLSCEYDDIYFAGKDKKRTHVFHSPEYYVIERAGKHELIDFKGNIVTKLSASDLFHVNDKWWAVCLGQNQADYRLYSIDDGLKNNALFDKIDKVAELTCLERPDYYYIKVIKNGKYGIIDKNGTMILDCKYEIIDEVWCRDVISGFFIKSEIGWGFFDNYSGSELHKGTIILDCVYDSIKVLNQTLSTYSVAIIFVVERNGKKALFINDKFVTDFKYDEFSWEAFTMPGDMFEILYILCADNKKYGIMKDYGELYRDIIYDEISFDDNTYVDGIFRIIMKKDGKEHLDEYYYPMEGYES